MFNSFSPPWEWAAVNADLDSRLRAGRSRARAIWERTAYVFADFRATASGTTTSSACFQRNRGGTEDEVRRRVLVGDPDAMIATLAPVCRRRRGDVIINLRPPYGLQNLESLAHDVNAGVL